MLKYSYWGEKLNLLAILTVLTWLMKAKVCKPNNLIFIIAIPFRFIWSFKGNDCANSNYFVDKSMYEFSVFSFFTSHIKKAFQFQTALWLHLV